MDAAGLGIPSANACRYARLQSSKSSKKARDNRTPAAAAEMKCSRHTQDMNHMVIGSCRTARHVQLLLLLLLQGQPWHTVPGTESTCCTMHNSHTCTLLMPQCDTLLVLPQTKPLPATCAGAQQQMALKQQKACHKSQACSKLCSGGCCSNHSRRRRGEAANHSSSRAAAVACTCTTRAAAAVQRPLRSTAAVAAATCSCSSCCWLLLLLWGPYTAHQWGLVC
jgi:hypothetical protein